MHRDILEYAAQGRAVAGKADMTLSELNTFFEMLKKGEVYEAITQAFRMGVYVGFKKGRNNGHRKTA